MMESHFYYQTEVMIHHPVSHLDVKVNYACCYPRFELSGMESTVQHPAR